MKITKLEHQHKRNSEVLVVNWCLTNICNFSCSYCPDTLHNGTNKGPKIEDIENFVTKIKQTHPNKKVFFEFTGGEVTYYKKFPELVNIVKDSGSDLGLISNGSRKLEFWEKYVDKIDHICLSFHSEQGDAEHFYNVVTYLCDKMRVHVNIMMNPDKFDICHDLALRINNSCNVSIAMQPLLENMDGTIFEYTEEQTKVLDNQLIPSHEDLEFKQAEDVEDYIYRGAMVATYEDGSDQYYTSAELITNKLNRWAGWICSAGIENIVIDMDGRVMRGWCGVGGVIGSIHNQDLKLPVKPVLCVKKECNCGLDIMCSKKSLFRKTSPIQT